MVFDTAQLTKRGRRLATYHVCRKIPRSLRKVTKHGELSPFLSEMMRSTTSPCHGNPMAIKWKMYGCPPTNKARKALKKVNILDDSVNSLPGRSDASDAYPAKTLWKISLFVDAWGGTDSCPTKLTAVSLFRNHYEQAHADSQRSHFKINSHELDATTVRFSVDIAHQDSMSNNDYHLKWAFHYGAAFKMTGMRVVAEIPPRFSPTPGEATEVSTASLRSWRPMLPPLGCNTVLCDWRNASCRCHFVPGLRENQGNARQRGEEISYNVWCPNCNYKSGFVIEQTLREADPDLGARHSEISTSRQPDPGGCRDRAEAHVCLPEEGPCLRLSQPGQLGGSHSMDKQVIPSFDVRAASRFWTCITHTDTKGWSRALHRAGCRVSAAVVDSNCSESKHAKVTRSSFNVRYTGVCPIDINRSGKTVSCLKGNSLFSAWR